MRARRHRGISAAVVSTPDRARAGPRGRASGVRCGARSARTRCVPAVQSAASPSRVRRRPADRVHEREPERRAHRAHRRRRRHSVGRARRRVPYARSPDSHSLRRFRGARRGWSLAAVTPVAWVRPRANETPASGRGSDPGRRRRAQEHDCGGQAIRRRRQPSHRRPRTSCDVAVVRTGGNTSRRVVRRGSRGGRPRSAPGVPVDEVRARPRPSRYRGAAPPRARRRVHDGARRHGARPRARVRRSRLWDRRDDVGRRVPRRRSLLVRTCRPPSTGCVAGRRGRDSRAVAHGRGVDTACVRS